MGGWRGGLGEPVAPGGDLAEKLASWGPRKSEGAHRPSPEKPVTSEEFVMTAVGRIHRLGMEGPEGPPEFPGQEPGWKWKAEQV